MTSDEYADETKQAWGYVRLSQKGRDTSLDEQKKSIREYARESDLNLVTTRNDGEGTSGFNQDRQGYQLLRQKIRNGEIDAVVVRDRARLSRDFDDRLSLIVDFRSTGVEWHVVEAGGRIPLENVETAGMECVHAMMGHVKKMAEIKRARAAVIERQESGCYQGQPPIGMEFADDKCHLKKNDMWDSVVEAFGLLESGEPYSTIEEETGLATHQISRMKQRGLEWYENTLEKYGVSG